MNEMRGGRIGGGQQNQNRQNWNERDDERKQSNSRNDVKDKDRDKRSASRWTSNQSPKSVVSDEENWDEEFEASNKSTTTTTSDIVKKNEKDSTKTTNSSNSSSNSSSKQKTNPIPQTEPIDDDSQEDDFNDFDDNSPTIDESATPNIDKQSNNDTEPQRVEPTRKVDQQQEEQPEQITQEQSTPSKELFSPQAKSFDMFSDDEIPTTKHDENMTDDTNEPHFIDSKDASSTVTAEQHHQEHETDGGTTPLYDELQDNKQHEAVSSTQRTIDDTEVKEVQQSAAADDVDRTTEEIDTEQPGIPGVDPITSD